MKKVVIYTRVSTDDQKEHGYSLEAQRIALERFCNEKNYEVVGHYQDDYSAKDFNRPAFNRFLEDLKSKRTKPNMIAITKIDRFSRNGALSYEMVRHLKEMGVAVYSLADGQLDFSNSKSFFPNWIMSGAAEYDNLQRAENTIKGMRQGLRQGRWMWNAPRGYKNENRLIVVDSEKAEIIRYAFEQFATGAFNAEEVRRMVKKKGLKVSKSGFLGILSNPFYTGKIKIEEYKDEPEEIVNGIHEPLITEDVYYRVQSILNGKKKGYKGKTKHEKLFLIGNLVCPKCGKKMTGSTSKGQGGYYHYYHCQRKYGCKHSIKAEEANEGFVSYLDKFQPSKDIIKLYRAILEDVFNSNSDNVEKKRVMKEKEISDLNRNIEVIMDKYANGILPDGEYRQFMDRFNAKKAELINEHSSLKNLPSEYAQYSEFALNFFENLSNRFQNANHMVKRKIIGLIFPESLVFENKTYRTTKINEVFAQICSLDKDLNKKLPNFYAGQFGVAPPPRLERGTP